MRSAVFAIFAISAVALVGCGPPSDPSIECEPDEVRRGDDCVPFNGTDNNDSNDTSNEYTCVDVCEKRLEICGFREFDGDFDVCLEVCRETPAEERNEACFVEETCVDIAEGLCNVDSDNNTGSGGGEYDAYTQADGPYCGDDARGYQTECEPGDICIDATSNRCERNTSSEYTAYAQGDGPYCGDDGRGYQTECRPGDLCIDAPENRCGPATGGTYQSYTQGDGPFCGEDDRGYQTECEPGDSCVNEATNTCAKG